MPKELTWTSKSLFDFIIGHKVMECDVVEDKEVKVSDLVV